MIDVSRLKKGDIFYMVGMKNSVSKVTYDGAWNDGDSWSDGDVGLALVFHTGANERMWVGKTEMYECADSFFYNEYDAHLAVKESLKKKACKTRKKLRKIEKLLRQTDNKLKELENDK
ncbi:hypothetical protein N9137_00960 [Pseudomonadales bacterium]|nr:hypothetical protein [Pseudomonadales bacterium]